MERLEQVRLAGPVRARDEHDPRLEGELEAWVRAEVAERDLADDKTAGIWRQSGSRIGMIRYEKLSSGETMRPGSERVDQLELHGLADHGLQAVPQEIRVEADLERLARIVDRNRLVRLPDVLGLRGHRQLTLREAQAQGCVSLCENPRAADDFEERLAGRSRSRPRRSPGEAACSLGTARRSCGS